MPNLWDLFAETLPDMPETLKTTEVQSARADTENRSLTLRLHFQRAFERELLFELEQQLKSVLDLNTLELGVSFSPEAFTPETVMELVKDLKRFSGIYNGFFDGAVASQEGTSLLITLKTPVPERFETEKVGEALSAKIKAEFGLEFDVRFAAADGAAEEQKKRLSGEIKPEKPKTAEKIQRTEPPADGLPVYLDSAKLIYGRPLKPNVKPVPIRELNQDSGDAVVWGEVVKCEKIPARFGNNNRVRMIITDHTSSYIVRFFADGGELARLSALVEGAAVLMRGRVTEDKYEHDFILQADSVALLDRYEEQDLEPEKRVELHMHTNMSQLDGLTPAGQLVNRAYKWGHGATAITDHGVVQAFPEAMNAVDAIRKNGGDFKVIYGVEAYFVNDMVEAVFGQSDLPFTGRFVVFDVETTGLNAHDCRLTEIGAVAVENGEVVGEFSSLINPQTPIPAKIVQLTGITDAMVAEAPLELPVLKDFLDFCGEAVLVAHNAPF
ncbi:MAG: PHP domain-containing protein, partial [Oscillospiraceae bacterium]|nr:PHP domain-containing protein [Oscillospiraceae bacterium]